MVSEAADTFRMKGEWKFYGVNFGWALRYAKSGKSVMALYPDLGRFTVQMILNNAQIQRALSEIADPAVTRKINDTEPVAEGKWIFLAVEESTRLEGILKLVAIRRGLK